MVTWKSGLEYPNSESLAEAYRAKQAENRKTMLQYFAATAVLVLALFVTSQAWTVLLGGAVAIVAIFSWMALRGRGYEKVAKAIEGESFTWSAGKIQNKWKKQMFDLSSGSKYQIGINDEWVECDYCTYADCQIGKLAVLVKDEGGYATGVMIPEGGEHKRVRRLARSHS